MAKKAPRRTRERILELSLRLYNDFGEPNVTTTTISEEMNISPGNLYYHYRNKDEITTGIFEQFEKEMSDLLDIASSRKASIEDTWLFLHLMFELIWKYRFVYRDINDLLSRIRRLELNFKSIMARKIQSAARMLDGLHNSGALKASPVEREALALNMVMISTYWLSYEYMQHARRFSEPSVQNQSMARGAYQVLSLVSPYLQGDSRALFDRLAREYLLTA